jgi:hypothetical protein
MQKPIPVVEMESEEYIKAYDVPTYPTYESLQTGAYGPKK